MSIYTQGCCLKPVLAVLILSLYLNAQSHTEKSARGKELYTAKCATCHGMYADRSALGGSSIINTMSKENIMVALLGYKDNTYGGSMKSVMKEQLRNYSDVDFEAFAAYIP